MDKLYTIQEVATKLNLSDKTLRRWEDAGRFTPSRTLGNQRRYSLDDLQVLDAIKHAVVSEQKDLLTLTQASKLCGVSPTTLLRWENQGKIHPLITSGNTYYPRQKLIEKMDSLKAQYQEPVPLEPVHEEPTITPQPAKIAPMEPPRTFSRRDTSVSLADNQTSSTNLRATLANILITMIILVAYHLIFNQKTKNLVSPTISPGSVQGVAPQIQPDPRIDDLITKFQDHLSSEMLKNSKPIPLTTINLDHTSLIYGTHTLSKGTNQVQVKQEQITATTPITVTFTSDYAPAKKYWVVTDQGSFTVYTDFPVSSDSTFNYNFITPTSSTSSTSAASSI